MLNEEATCYECGHQQNLGNALVRMVHRLYLTQVEELVSAFGNLTDPQRAELDLFTLFILC